MGTKLNNKHYIWQSVRGTTRIDIDETPPKAIKKKNASELLEKRFKRERIESIIGLVGILIGMGLGVWMVVQIFLIQTK